MSARLKAGCAALWVSHDAAQAKRMARRALDVAAGSVTERVL